VSDYQYIIVGGGLTADTSVRGIRKLDKAGRIGVFTAEKHAPYNRPPLSKALWKGEPFETIWRNTPTENLDLHLTTTVASIDIGGRQISTHAGSRFTYDKLLIATGGSVRKLPFDVPGIIYFRDLDDYLQLKELTGRKTTFVVIGGGFIGTEIAAALSMNRKQVTMIFPDGNIGEKVYPPSLTRFLNEFYEAKGVSILSRNGVAAISRNSDGFLVTTLDGQLIQADGVVAGIGIQPNIDIARTAGLSIGNGIVVDEYLRTSNPDIYAAGDVAEFFSPALDRRVRVEHEDHALHSGEIAGLNMAGGNTPYHHLPFFYSDLFELGYEAVGQLNSRFEMVEDWKDLGREGVVYYLDQGRVRGVLLWNTWGQVDAARALVAERGPFTAKDLPGRLPARAVQSAS
jgi:3-phenylpropionate/trans-cinnamate dioxygenase ferredoxin reductase subunit